MGEALRLRATTARDLDFVLAVEEDPDLEPFITPWPRSRHAEAWGRTHAVFELRQPAARC
jgi:hypothetical protein